MNVCVTCSSNLTCTSCLKDGLHVLSGSRCVTCQVKYNPNCILCDDTYCL